MNLDDVTGGWTTLQQTALITSSSGNAYVQYTLTGTTDAGPDHEVDFNFNSNSDNVDVMFIDNITITEN